MSDTGRPVAALLISALALLWPVWSAPPEDSTHKVEAVQPEIKRELRSDVTVVGSTSESSPTSTESQSVCCYAPRTNVGDCTKECCEGNVGVHFVGSDECDGSFLQFLSEVESDDLKAPERPRVGSCQRLPAGDVTRVIATLPDPLATGMRAAFDEGLDALFEAMEAQGFYRDRFWSPWHGAEGVRDFATCAERVPAVFTFRRRAPDPGNSNELGTSKLVVELYVVGESPTSGIRRTPLALSLQLAGAANPIGRDPIRIIGPTFSGSADSLNRVLNSFATDGAPGRVRIATGTASVEKIAGYLRQGHRDFGAYVLSNETLRQAFFEYLQRSSSTTVKTTPNGGGGATYRWLEHVALFTEAGTLFGGTLTAANTIVTPPPGSPADPGADAHTPCTLTQPCQASILMRFPLHIGTIRESFSEQVDKLTATQALGPIPLKQTELHPGHDSAERLDTPSPLSRQTGAAEDQILTDQLRVLEEEDTRVVGVAASDPVDALFLVRHIRERLPNARLFAFDHDAMFEHPEYAHALRGVMLVNSYPDTAQADRWVPPYNESWRRLFSSPSATGIYNAALFGTALDVDPKDADRNNLYKRVLGYGAPFSVPRVNQDLLPSVWVSAVGVTGIVPVVAMTPHGDCYTARISRPTALDGGNSGCIALDDENVFAGAGWNALASSISILGFLYAFGVYLGITGRQVPVAFRWLYMFRPTSAPGLGEGLRWRTAVTIAVLGSAMSIACVLLLLVPPLHKSMWCASTPINPHVDWLSWADIGFCWFSLAIATLSVDVVWLGVCTNSDAKPFRVVAAFAVAGVPIARLYQVGFDSSDRVFMYFRWTSINSQLSPIVSLVILTAMLTVCASQYLAQAQFGGKHGAAVVCDVLDLASLDLPSGEPRSLVARRFHNLQDLLVRCASLRSFPFLCGVFASLTLVCVVIDPGDGRFSTLESSPVTCLLGLALLCVLAMTAGGIAATMTLGTALALMLRRVRAHPFGKRLREVQELLESRIRFPFAGLSDGAEQLRVWVVVARRLISELPEVADWTQVADDAAVERMAVAARRGDVIKGLELARRDQPAIPTDILKAMRAAWSAGVLPRDAGPIAAGERLGATYVALFLFWAIRQLRIMAGFSISGALLLAIGVASYPFTPSREIATLAATLVITTLVTSLGVFVILERDPLLSEFAGTTPGSIEWSWAFFQQLATWVLLPFAAFLATQYPEEFRSLVGWMSPYVHTH